MRRERKSAIFVARERASDRARDSKTKFFWSLLEPPRDSPQPMGRYEAATTLVEARSTLYLFGGRSFNRSFNDLWEFNLLKRERIRRRTYRAREEARRDVFDYIEMFYNPKRKHARNGMLSPLEFERQQKLRHEGV